jgi:tRNA splicing ligase
MKQLIDDSFEEHVLSYPSSEWGIYLHGLHPNTIAFKPLPYNTIKSFAERFGFKYVDCKTLQTFDGKLSISISYHKKT